MLFDNLHRPTPWPRLPAPVDARMAPGIYLLLLPSACGLASFFRSGRGCASAPTPRQRHAVHVFFSGASECDERAVKRLWVGGLLALAALGFAGSRLGALPKSTSLGSQLFRHRRSHRHRVPALGNCAQVKATEKALPGLNGVKTVLCERERPGARRRPGSDETHLDDIERAWCARKPAARLVDLELRPIWQLPCSWKSGAPGRRQ